LSKGFETKRWLDSKKVENRLKEEYACMQEKSKKIGDSP
jgi:hypothetical protein